jgi:pimeloyl-ACP methyl ester carboxylesterase
MALAVYLGFGAYLFAFQEDLMYRPSRPAMGLHGHETLQVTSQGETINVWRANPGRADAILYFGGNAEAVVYQGTDFAELVPHATTYLVDYRGYGASTGTPSEAALYRDALAVYDQVATEHATVHVVGRSLGTGVATYLAIHRPVGRLVLVTPYDSIANLAAALYPAYPVSLMLRDRYDSLSRAAELAVPTLVVLAGRDRVVPPEHGRRLADAIEPAFVTVQEVPEAGHFDVMDRTAYRDALRGFLARPR